MQTEIEKYERIQQFLSGQLTGAERKSFEAQMQGSGALRTEVEMHRLANEIAIDHYVIGLKATTSKVIRRKAIESKWKNWGLGLGLGVIVATSFWLYVQNDPKQEVTVSNRQEIGIAAIAPTPQSSEEIKSSNQQAGLAKAPFEKKTVATKANTASKPATPRYEGLEPSQPSNGLEQPERSNQSVAIVPPLPIEQTVVSEIAPEKEITSAASVAKPVSPSLPIKDLEEKPKEVQAPIELVLNPLQGTEVELPVDAEFTGEFTVFDPNGATIYRCNIQNGQPHTWDGQVISGGTAGAGQYGFVLKSSTGKESVGYVTVLR